MSFTPVIKTAHSVANTLLEFAKDRKIDAKDLDFELISYETLVRRESIRGYEIVDKLNPLTKEDMLNEETLITQEYSIKIVPLKLENSSVPFPKMVLSVNKTKTKALITIPKGSVFGKKDKAMLKYLRDEIYKKKLRAGLFINVFENNLVENLKKLLSVVPEAKPIAKELKFGVAIGVVPVAPVDAKLEKIYKNKKDKNDSIIDGVDKDELIARYYKPKNGLDGRACNGKFIKTRSPRTLNMQPVVDEESVLEKEQEDYIEYFAKTDGYVAFTDGKFTISKTLKLSGADYKSSANIDSGDGDKDISVIIEHSKSHAEDAIGSGVKIDVKKLNVDGAIGSNVKIATQELNVDAQTHKKSTIEVKNSANVKLHRGDLKAKDAQIDTLENGKVTAHRSIHIKQMLGGEAVAPIVKVDLLLSNSTIIASELIEIKSLQGQNNRLIINPDKVGSYHDDIQELKDSIKEQGKVIRNMQESFNEELKKHNSKHERINVFKKRVLQATQDGKAPMKQDVIRIKSYKKDVLKIKDSQAALDAHKQKLLQLEEKLEKMYDLELGAKIINYSKYDGHTRVVFFDPKEKEEITEMPEGAIHTISLVIDVDGKRVIKLD